MRDMAYEMADANQLAVLFSSIKPAKKAPSGCGPRNASPTIKSKEVQERDKYIKERKYIVDYVRV